ncbi:MAG: DUF333 domain-containing protein [Desulfamplus sp.]|nr:DUF333 domain-containing protein [Desulfamplus sp.]
MLKKQLLSTKQLLYLIFLLSAFIFIVACKDNRAGEYKETTPSENDSKPSMANPAATRCVNDGYSLEPIIENGVNVDYLCVNPETGFKCEIWKYFRNECSLKP